MYFKLLRFFWTYCNVKVIINKILFCAFSEISCDRPVFVEENTQSANFFLGPDDEIVYCNQKRKIKTLKSAKFVWEADWRNRLLHSSWRSQLTLFSSIKKLLSANYNFVFEHKKWESISLLYKLRLEHKRQINILSKYLLRIIVCCISQ